MKPSVSIICLSLLVSSCAIRSRGPDLSFEPARETAQSRSPAPGDWSSVVGIRPGTSLEARLKDGTKHSGRFVKATETSLVISDSLGGERSVQKAEVYRIQSLEKDPVRNGVLTGMLIGFLGGFLGEGLLYHATGSTGQQFPDPPSWGAGVLGVGIGALTGWMVDRSILKRTILYQSK